MKITEDHKHFVSLCHRDRPDLSAAALHDHLVMKYGHKWPIPSAASIRAILEERGHVRPPPLPEGRELDPPIPGTFEPNDVWCVDLLGASTTADGRRWITVSIIDSYTRYLIRLDVISEAKLGSQLDPVLRSAYRDAGMPKVLRVRPVPPFQVDGPQGLSSLDVWILRSHLVLDRRPDAPFVTVPYAPPPAAAHYPELVRAADLYRKEHNAREVVGFRGSPTTYASAKLVDLREQFLADCKATDDEGNLRWAGFRLALGPELARIEISFTPADHPRFTEVGVMTVPLGLLDHARPERGLIPAPILPRLSIEYPLIEVDWEAILVEDLQQWLATTASSRAARTRSRRPSSRGPKRRASSGASR